MARELATLGFLRGVDVWHVFSEHVVASPREVVGMTIVRQGRELERHYRGVVLVSIFVVDARVRVLGQGAPHGATVVIGRDEGGDIASVLHRVSHWTLRHWTQGVLEHF